MKKHNQYAQISWTHLTESGDVWLKEKWPLLPMAVKTGGTSVNNQMKGKAAKVWDVFCQRSRKQVRHPIFLELQGPLNITHFKLFYGYISNLKLRVKQLSTQCPWDNSHTWSQLLTLGSSSKLSPCLCWDQAGLGRGKEAWGHPTCLTLWWTENQEWFNQPWERAVQHKSVLPSHPDTKAMWLTDHQMSQRKKVIFKKDGLPFCFLRMPHLLLKKWLKLYSKAAWVQRRQLQGSRQMASPIAMFFVTQWGRRKRWKAVIIWRKPKDLGLTLRDLSSLNLEQGEKPRWRGTNVVDGVSREQDRV